MQAKREKQYNEIMQQYDRAEQSVFAELFAQMVTALEEQPEQDFLGDMFMRLELAVIGMVSFSLRTVCAGCCRR